MNFKSSYIDGFVLPIPRKHLDEYSRVATEIAKIWKEYGAVSYNEYVGDDLWLEGTRSFPELLIADDGEVVIFGWVVFESKEARDRANKQVPTDPRMSELIKPLIDPSTNIFDASRMGYGGFKPLVSQ